MIEWPNGFSLFSFYKYLNTRPWHLFHVFYGYDNAHLRNKIEVHVLGKCWRKWLRSDF